MMIPGKYNIEIQKGSTWEVTLTAQNSAGNDVQFNTYQQAVMEVYPPWLKVATGQSGIYKLSTYNNRIAISSTSLKLTLTAHETNTIPFTNGSYTLDLLVTTKGSERTDRFLVGNFTIKGLS